MENMNDAKYLNLQLGTLMRQLEALEAVPTEAAPLEASLRAPGLRTTIVTSRTRVPPGPTESVAAMASMVPGRVSRVPSTVTEALWPT